MEPARLALLPPHAAVTPGYLSPNALGRVGAFIETHLFEPVTLDDLARAAHLSRFHFSRRFHLATGLTPMNFLQLRRIERAKRLLLAGRYSVSEIATRLVFADHSHFSRVFRRAAGCSPSQFVRAGSAP